MQLLSYGLSFCPTPSQPDRADLIDHVEKFIRKLKLHCHFDRSSANDTNVTLTDNDPTLDSLS